MKKKSLKPEGQMLRGVVYRLIESLASMGHSSIWKLICAISVCNTLTVGVHYQAPPALVVLDPPLILHILYWSAGLDPRPSTAVACDIHIQLIPQ